MNEITLTGELKNIQHSHIIEDVEYGKANIISKRPDGREDVINLRFKSFSNPYKENDIITLKGNVRSYSYKIDENTNKVTIYVFTYFDRVDGDVESNNTCCIDGRICKLNSLRTTKNGKHNIHFIIANNITSNSSMKRLNSYIPCIAWGTLAKEIANLSVNTKIKLNGELHSREHKKIRPDGEIEIRVAHELLVLDYEVVD